MCAETQTREWTDSKGQILFALFTDTHLVFTQQQLSELCQGHNSTSTTKEVHVQTLVST